MRRAVTKLISFFGAQMEKTIRDWPELLRRDVRESFGRRRRRVRRDALLHSGMRDQPYWVLLPLWLAGAFGGRKVIDPAGRRFMKDILWGQFCLYVFIRFQDDLFDGHTGRMALIYASDMFLIEAERAFGKHFPRASPFWDIFRNGVHETLRAVMTADGMERMPVKNTKRLLDAHGATSSICNVASAAVCHRTGHPGMVRRVSRFSTEMMKTGAILDDLEDMEQDIGRARFNYASAFFLPGFTVGHSWQHSACRLIARNFLLSDGSTKLFANLYRHLAKAEREMKSFVVPEARRYLRSYRASVEALENSLHRARVCAVLGT